MGYRGKLRGYAFGLALAGGLIAAAQPGWAGCGPVADTAAGFLDRFKTLDPGQWHVAEYDFSHPHFDTDWRRSRVTAGAVDRTAPVDHLADKLAGRAPVPLPVPAALPAPTGLRLDLRPHDGGLNRYAGGSLRRQDRSGFGQYHGRLRAARGPGVVTGLFVYTGPAYGTRHDEIDIEILGHQTDRINLAWFVDGARHERRLPLGFDAAAGLHDYGFDWQPDRITWFVDGQPVFRITLAEAPIPQVPGYVFANLWAVAPGLASWAGRPRPGTRAQAHFTCIGFDPLPAPSG